MLLAVVDTTFPALVEKVASHDIIVSEPSVTPLRETFA
jgi:hypothetical protein